MDILSDALLGAATGSWAALIGYLVSATARGQLGSVRRSVTARRPYFWLAGLAGAMGQLSFFAALNFAPVSEVSVVASAEIVLTVLFAAIATHTEHQPTDRPAGDARLRRSQPARIASADPG